MNDTSENECGAGHVIKGVLCDLGLFRRMYWHKSRWITPRSLSRSKVSTLSISSNIRFAETVTVLV
jgi:hypothetical protein